MPGSFAWTTPSTVPTGSGSYGVTFTPTDAANYNTVTTNVSVTVNVAITGPQFASFYNDLYPFTATSPTLKIIGSNLTLATKGFHLIDAVSPTSGKFTVSTANASFDQLLLGLPTSLPSGTY